MVSILLGLAERLDLADGLLGGVRHDLFLKRVGFSWIAKPVDSSCFDSHHSLATKMIFALPVPMLLF